MVYQVTKQSIQIDCNGTICSLIQSLDSINEFFETVTFIGHLFNRYWQTIYSRSLNLDFLVGYYCLKHSLLVTYIVINVNNLPLEQIYFPSQNLLGTVYAETTIDENLLGVTYWSRMSIHYAPIFRDLSKIDFAEAGNK